MAQGNQVKHKQDQMHIHHWQTYGPSQDSKTVYLLCTNRTKWMCLDCEHIPCRCAQSIPLTEWENMATYS